MSDAEAEPRRIATAPTAGYGPQNLAPFRAWYAVLIVSLVSIFAQIDRGVITLLVTPIKRDLDLTDVEVSMLIGVAFSLFYVGASIPLARLADRWSRRGVLSLALAAWSTATAACALAQTFMQFFVLRGLIGGFEGVKSPCSTSMIADLVPRQHLARAFAIFTAATTGGAALALVVGGALLSLFAKMPPVSLPLVGELRDWQLIFLAVGLPGVLFAIVLRLSVPESLPATAKEQRDASFVRVMRYTVEHRRVFFPYMAISSLNAISGGAIATWRPVFFERTYDWDPAFAGPLLGSTALAASLLGLFTGPIAAEWLGRRREDANMSLVMIGYLVALPLQAASLLAPSGALSLILGTVAMVCTLSAVPAQLAALQIISPREMRSQTSALYFITLNVIGIAGGPFLTALATDWLFGAEEMLRYSLLIVLLVTGPLSLWLNIRVLRPYVAYARAYAEGEGRA